ncbi:MAG: vitamin K epoxide reductase family protein, partial [Ktedonobacterales bacterium]
VDCGPVLKSSFSVVPGTQLPITVPGMLWFAVSGGMAALALGAALRGRAEPERLRLAQLVWSAVGLLFALYLVYAELVRLRHICAWCTGIHVLTLLTFLVALARWQATLLSESAGSPRRDPAPTRAPYSTSAMNGANAARRTTTPAGPAVSRRAAKSFSQRATSRARGK